MTQWGPKFKKNVSGTISVNINEANVSGDANTFLQKKCLWVILW